MLIKTGQKIIDMKCYKNKIQLAEVNISKCQLKQQQLLLLLLNNKCKIRCPCEMFLLKADSSTLEIKP